MSSSSPSHVSATRPLALRRGRQCANGRCVNVALLLKDADAIAPVALGLLQGAVGRAHERVLGPYVARGIKADSDRHGDGVKLGTADRVPLVGDVAPDALGHGDGAAE